MSSVIDPNSAGSDASRRRLDTTKLAAGTKVGQYTILHEIDRGGMAIVYKARQHSLDREVALKVLPPSVSLQSKFIDRFQKEAKAVAQLDHPNIVKIIEVGGDAGIYFIAMEFLDGLNLYKYLMKFEPTVYLVVQIISQMADALEYAHGRNIIHRDLKLNNVIMKDNAHPVLIDFGLAKAREADTSITISGEIVGSPSYMSPEQASGNRVDERTDIFSLGVMFYELLTGRNPFFDKRGYQQTIWNVINAEIRPLRRVSDWIPRDVEVIVMKCLERDLDKRYLTMRALRLDLERYQTGEPIQARSPGFIENAIRKIKRRRGLVTIVSTVVLFFALFIFYYNYQRSLETADWKAFDLKSTFYTNIDSEWHGLWGSTGDTIRFLNMDSPWLGSEGKLQVSAEDYTYITWQGTFSGDARIEFNLESNREINREFGIFLRGPAPDQAYSLRFAEGNLYLSKRNRSNIINAVEGVKIDKKKPVRIRFEKEDIAIRVFIDGNLMLSYDDFSPISGESENRFGFYADNAGYIISNVKLFQLGVPLKTRPIQTAERFFEKGYFADAIEEYRRIVSLYPDNPMSGLAQFKIGLSFMSMGEHEKAIPEFEKILKSGPDGIIPMALDEIAECHSILGSDEKTEKTLLLIRDRYPNSAVLISRIAAYKNRLIDLSNNLDTANSSEAEKTIRLLSRNFAQYGQFFASGWLAYGDALMRKRSYPEARIEFAEMKRVLAGNINEAAIAEVREADIEAACGGFDRAVTLYNKIIVNRRNSPKATAESWLGLGLVNRAQGKTNDAIRCYSFVVDNFGDYRDLAAIALLGTAFAYQERAQPDPVADAIYKKITTRYRDQNEASWIARAMTGDAAWADGEKKNFSLWCRYANALYCRKKGDYIGASKVITSFKKEAAGYPIGLRLAEIQLAYIN
ncbi:MAG: protein kinase [Fibrobacteres bacterium]|nr:protein kinase [Fibrobacterota bacterium]